MIECEVDNKNDPVMLKVAVLVWDDGKCVSVSVGLNTERDTEKEIDVDCVSVVDRLTDADLGACDKLCVLHDADTGCEGLLDREGSFDGVRVGEGDAVSV